MSNFVQELFDLFVAEFSRGDEIPLDDGDLLSGFVFENDLTPSIASAFLDFKQSWMNGFS